MFRQFVKDRLASVDTKKSEFLLIGEDHQNSSALVGLAHCLPEIIASGKNVIVITEDLKRKSNMLGQDQQYSNKDVNNVMHEKDRDIDAVNQLIKAGVKVYGMESKATAPGLFLKSETKDALFKEVKKSNAKIIR